MKVFKVLGTVILGGLLFLSLVVLGVAFTVQSTMLNPDFVVRQTDKLDLPAVVRELTGESLGDDLSPENEFILDIAYRVAEEQEPWLKEQLGNGIRAGYDYLLGKTGRLLINVPLRELKQDLRDTIWRAITEDPAAWLPLFQDDLNAYINESFTALAPEIRQHLPAPLAVLPIEALGPALQEYVLQIEEQIASGNLPPGAYDLILAIARPYFDEYYDEIVTEIPDEYTIDSTTIPADVMSGLLLAREYLGYFKSGYFALIVLAVVLAAGIALIHLNVRTPCLALGIVLLAAGALELAGVFFAGSVSLKMLVPDIPASLGAWIDGFYGDVLGVARWFSIGLLAAGAVLLAVFFLYRPRGAAD